MKVAPSRRAASWAAVERGPVELLRELDVDQLVALEQVLDVLVALEHRERDRDAEHRVRVLGGDQLAELVGRDQRPDGLVDDHRVAVIELAQPEVDRFLARRPPPTMHDEPRGIEAVVGDQLPRLLEMRFRAGDDDPVDVGGLRAPSRARG